MENSTTPLSYDDLELSAGQIRLLYVLPTHENDKDIKCRLEVVTWSPELRYAALSYVWGDPDTTQQIFVNGHHFEATKNLRAALWHIRKHDVLLDGLSAPDGPGQRGCLPLWVDAICVNQKDCQERNDQVMFMGSIYGSADKVIGWLGPGVGHQDEAIRAIQGLTEAAFSHGPKPSQEKIVEFFSVYDFRQSLGAGSSISSSTWDLLFDLFQEEFWTRVWIVQELVLPPSPDSIYLMLGDQTMSWSCVMQFYKVMAFITNNQVAIQVLDLPNWIQKRLMTTNPFAAIAFVGMLRERQKNRDSRESSRRQLLLGMSAHYQATDPRDMFYGFSAITDIKTPIDYRKTVKEVYMDWFKSALPVKPGTPNDEQNLMVYTGLGSRRSNEFGLPSWLPDLSSYYQKRWDRRNLVHKIPRGGFKELGDEPAQVAGNALYISGVRLGDVVTKRFSPEDYYKDNHCLRVHMMETCFTIGLHASEHPLGIPPVQAFIYAVVGGFSDGHAPLAHPPNDKDIGAWRLIDVGLCSGIMELTETDFASREDAGAPRHEWHLGRFQTIEEMKEAIKEQILYGAEPHSRLRTLLTMPRIGRGDRDYDTMTSAVERLTAFQTAKGYIGLGPPELAVGDQLCLLDRCNPPILLRTMEDGTTGNVGPCYVYGLSDMNIEELVRSGDGQFEKFSIY